MDAFSLYMAVDQAAMGCTQPETICSNNARHVVRQAVVEDTVCCVAPVLASALSLY